ncbi:unnamed protein product [Calypogeia fissa]
MGEQQSSRSEQARQEHTIGLRISTVFTAVGPYLWRHGNMTVVPTVDGTENCEYAVVTGRAKLRAVEM